MSAKTVDIASAINMENKEKIIGVYNIPVVLQYPVNHITEKEMYDKFENEYSHVTSFVSDRYGVIEVNVIKRNKKYNN